VISIGKINQLEILRRTDFGFYLDGQGDEADDILLPKRYITEEMKPGDIIDVFVYSDSEDRIVATTETPLAMVDDFAFLKVVDKNTIGAFLNWGLSKDLLVPHSEQETDMIVGESYVVRVYEDNTGRLAASTKLDKFMSRWPSGFEDGQEVGLVICEKTDLGYKAIVESKKWGLIYFNELFQELKRGQEIRGFIKKVRDDDKIDLCLKNPKFEKNQGLLDEIVDHLKKNDGHSDLNDKCSPADIYKTYRVSKSQYKNALGMLYRQKLIKIEKSGITLLKKIIKK
jgi:uncharacterized protein